MNKRLLYIDGLKGLAIFLVILGHMLQHYYSDSSYGVRLISSFHMPLFMFMSGYVCFKKSEWSMISKRAVQLLVPFFSYIVLNIVFWGIKTGVWHSLSESLVNTLLHPDYGLWFLWALFFISVLHIACKKLSSICRIKEWIVYGIVAIVLNAFVYIFNFKLFGFHWIAWYFIYYMTGIVWRNYDFKLDYNPEIYRKLLPSILITFFVMSLFFRMHNEAPSFYRWINLGSIFIILYRFLIGIAGIAVSLCLFRIYKSLSNKALCQWGG